jgi:hypothetical protein
MTELVMHTDASRISSGESLVGLATQATEDSRQDEARFSRLGSTDDEWGRSDSLDPDNVGDIADEGAGHRG